MFNNVAIDVALGLIFIFLLYSLLASIFQEILARWFGLRARTLLKGLRRMLEDGDSSYKLTAVNFFIDIGNNAVDYFRPLKKKTFLKAFYDHPNIKYLGENNSNSKPSYIDAGNFSKTVMQLLRGDGYNSSLNQMQAIRNNLLSGKIDNFSINPQSLKMITKLWVDSNNDIERFRANLEEWFNRTMDRATGWYKKQTQLMLFLIGWGVAAGFNVDPIAITKILAGNEGIRKELVNLATSRQKKYEEILKSQKDSIIIDPVTNTKTIVRYVNLNDSELNELNNTIKTDGHTVQQILGLGPRKNMDPAIKEKYQKNLSGAQVGWLLTGLAISLGAAFWFDLLSKIMMIRNAGNKPVEGNDDKNGSKRGTSVKPVG